MSTFIQIQPTEHDDKKTTLIRLDDDFKCTVRVEERNKDPETYQFNFTGLEEGDQLVAGQRGVSDPIEYVRVVKLGTDARCIIGVKAYHLPDEADTVPSAGMYWYPWKTQVDPEPILRAAKGEPEPVQGGNPSAAADPAFEGGATQSWETIYNIATDITNHPIPTGARATVSFQADTRNLYTQLGSVEARRQHLKSNLRKILDDPEYHMWLLGSEYDFINDSNGATNLIGSVQAFVFWLEMMARAISIDSNLNTLQKFNLLNGESELPGSNIIAYHTIRSGYLNHNKNGWTFRRFGSIGAAPNYEYTKPTGMHWRATQDSIITLTNPNVGENWVTYIRSF